MADPLRHSSKLDIAEEILEYIADDDNNAKDVREKIMLSLDLTNDDLRLAADVVRNISNLIRDQKF